MWRKIEVTFVFPFFFLKGGCCFFYNKNTYTIYLLSIKRNSLLSPKGKMGKVVAGRVGATKDGWGSSSWLNSSLPTCEYEKSDVLMEGILPSPKSLEMLGTTYRSGRADRGWGGETAVGQRSWGAMSRRNAMEVDAKSTCLRVCDKTFLNKRQGLNSYIYYIYIYIYTHTYICILAVWILKENPLLLVQFLTLWERKDAVNQEVVWGKVRLNVYLQRA